MILIDTEFTKHGYIYKQEKRTDYSAVYRVIDTRFDIDDRFEAVKLQVVTKHPFKKVTEPYEAYPGTSSWGTNGFTFDNRAKAIEKMHDIYEAALNSIRKKEKDLA